MKILLFLDIAFRAWMLFDCIKRRAEFYWYLIIPFVPGGALVYFFVVRTREQRPALSGRLELQPEAMGELRQRALETPSLANKIELADALYERNAYDDAATVYEEVLAREAEEKAALHGLGCTRLAQGRSEDAVRNLWMLGELDNSYRDYSAVLDLAEALSQDGQLEEAVELLEGLVRKTERINHRLALAHYLNVASRKAEARTVLEQALTDYEAAPVALQRQNKKWAERAENMLDSLGAPS